MDALIRYLSEHLVAVPADELRDRYRWALLGLCVGNALGIGIEGWTRTDLEARHVPAPLEISPDGEAEPWDDVSNAAGSRLNVRAGYFHVVRQFQSCAIGRSPDRCYLWSAEEASRRTEVLIHRDLPLGSLKREKTTFGSMEGRPNSRRHRAGG